MIDTGNAEAAFQHTPICSRMLTLLVTKLLSPGCHRSITDRRYLQHPEAKSLAPDGGPCNLDTRGLLQRAHIIAGKHRRIGKESDRRWEEGDDFEALQRRPTEYEPTKAKAAAAGQSRASESLIRQVKKIGMRQLMRLGVPRRNLAKICRRELVNDYTLHEYETIIREYKQQKTNA